MAYTNTGHKRPTAIIIKKAVGAGAPTVETTLSLLDSFVYNSVTYAAITEDALTKLSLEDYSTRFNALQSHINNDLQVTYPGINLTFDVEDYDVVDLTACPI